MNERPRWCGTKAPMTDEEMREVWKQAVAKAESPDRTRRLARFRKLLRLKW